MSLKKTAPRDNPHAIFATPDGAWRWNVLKTYKAPKGEARDAYARWFCLVTSPYCPDGEIGDVYIREIKGAARLVHASDAWREAYGN